MTLRLRSLISNWIVRRRKKIVSQNLANRAKKRQLQTSRPSEVLSPQEINELKQHFSGLPTDPVPYHTFYKAATGKFDWRNMPDDLYYQYIDRYFNNWDMAKYVDNKTLYRLWFSDIKQPETLVYRQNGFWFNNTGSLISTDSALALIEDSHNIFIKQATESLGGHGVFHVADGRKQLDEIKSIFNSIKADIIVQHGLKQSETLSKINPSSINTVRIVTLLMKDGTVRHLSSVLRMGIGDSKVDNASSGGITVGIDSNGCLRSRAFSNSGVEFDKHPTTGVRFPDFAIPSYSKALETVMKKAAQLPFFRLISWDIAIDYSDEPVLIEANLCDGELDFHQLDNGPIFGELTDEILTEVFGKR